MPTTVSDDDIAPMVTSLVAENPDTWSTGELIDCLLSKGFALKSVLTVIRRLMDRDTLAFGPEMLLRLQAS